MIMTNAPPSFFHLELAGWQCNRFLSDATTNGKVSQSQSEQFMLVVRFFLLIALLVVTFKEFNSITFCLGAKVDTELVITSLAV